LQHHRLYHPGRVDIGDRRRTTTNLSTKPGQAHVAVRRLHRRLETYRPPRSANAPKRNLRVFRYEDDQRLEPSLRQALIERVAAADDLVLAVSKAAAASPNVQLEVASAKRVLYVLVADTVEEAGIPGDPVYADCRDAALPWPRWILGGHRRFNRNTLPLLAELLGVEPDELAQREKRRRHRRWGLAALVVLLAITASVALLLRTPSEAWMPTDAAVIERQLDEAVVTTDGQSIRASTFWFEYYDDARADRSVIMELDSSGRQTGVAGLEWNTDFETVRIKPTLSEKFGGLGTLADDVEGKNWPGSLENARDPVPIREASKRRPCGSLGGRAPCPGPKPQIAANDTVNACFVLSKDRKACFIHQFDENYNSLTLPVLVDRNKTTPGERIGRQLGQPLTLSLAGSTMYVATEVNAEELIPAEVLRSTDGLRWTPIPLKREWTGQLAGVAASAGTPPLIAVSVFDRTRAHIHLSADEGKTWRELTQDVPVTAVADLAGITRDGTVAALFAADHRDPRLEKARRGELRVFRSLTWRERMRRIQLD